MTTRTSAAPKFERIAPEARRARLVEASITCLARHGLQGFTVDNICRESGTSRGLITHHFGSKDALLAAVYAAVYGRLLDNLDRIGSQPRSLDDLVSLIFAASSLSLDELNVWLALWGEIAINPVLQDEHRRNYALYRERVARLISAYARSKRITVDSYEVATVMISLADGLWLELCIDRSQLSLARARDLYRRTLAALLKA